MDNVTIEVPLIAARMSVVFQVFLSFTFTCLFCLLVIVVSYFSNNLSVSSCLEFFTILG